MLETVNPRTTLGLQGLGNFKKSSDLIGNDRKDGVVAFQSPACEKQSSGW
jgi:hypothetical protein